ncbi:glutathione S-transferase theta-1-like [Dreissena polymorpha]|uniref:Glutathione transferase n=1 Tax=Dreissena polymorpha TaxID=45954 RepID=A0A9D4MZ27_DREPO|nr:glutathione S-transferase theta-1-like [Dreissena polymorpha]KAH3884374.1 hypothetical protein DPMN_008352 [Dreissena polymorpha]
MGAVKFYADLRSQPCRAVFIFMKANAIQFEMEKVDLFLGEQLQEKFTQVHSIQRVPVIDDDGFVLGESGAIFRYLSRKFNVADHWYPAADLTRQARIDEYLHWHHTNIRVNAMMTFRHIYINKVRGKPIKEDEVRRHKSELSKALNHIASYFLKERRFLCGNDISVADIQALCELMQLDAVREEGLYLSNPIVGAWIGRVKARVQPYLAECEAEGVGMMKQMYEAITSSSKL